MRGLGRPLALLGALACALAAWLLAPIHAAGAAPLHVCLVDASASVTSPRRAWEAWAAEVLAEEARLAQQAGRELVVVRFGADLARLFGPARAAAYPLERGGAGADLLGADDRGSDLQGALELARTLSDGRPCARLALLSDGSFTGTRPDPELADWAARGALLAWREPPPPERTDVAITALVLPPDPEPGAPLACVVEGLWSPGTQDRGRAREIEVVVEVTDARGERTRRRRVTVAADSGSPGSASESPSKPPAPWSTRLDLGLTEPGLTRLVCRVELLGPTGSPIGDPLPGNNERAASLLAGDVRVGVICATDELGPAADAWRASLGDLEGLQFFRAAPEDLPVALAEADLLITLDHSERTLAPVDLAGFVERGGGWLACGGFALLAGEVGPLTPLVAATPEAERTRVLLLVDGSGSMQGEAYDGLRAAVLRLLALAPADASFELAFFTDHIDTAHALPVTQPAAAARALLAARAPGGPTDLHATLRELETRAGAERLLVCLFSDGRDQPSDSAALQRASEVRAGLERAGCEVVPIAMGSDADLAALRVWCREDSVVLTPADDEALFAVLRERVGRDWSRTRNGIEVRPAAVSDSRSGVGRELAASLAGAFPAALERHLLARPARSTVDSLLETLDGEPLLVVESRGAGAVAALATLPAPGWAPDWATQPTLLAPVLRALARGRGPRAGAVRAAVEEGVLRVTGVPGDWPARIWARRSAALDSSWAPLDLPAAAEGEDPRSVRIGRLPPALPGKLPATRATQQPGGAGSPAPEAPWTLALAASPGARADRLALVSLAPGPDEESRLPARRVDRGALSTGPGTPGGPGVPGGGGERGSHPAGSPALLLGLACLALAAGLGWGRPRTHPNGASR